MTITIMRNPRAPKRMTFSLEMLGTFPLEMMGVLKTRALLPVITSLPKKSSAQPSGVLGTISWNSKSRHSVSFPLTPLKAAAGTYLDWLGFKLKSPGLISIWDVRTPGTGNKLPSQNDTSRILCPDNRRSLWSSHPKFVNLWSYSQQCQSLLPNAQANLWIATEECLLPKQSIAQFRLVECTDAKIQKEGLILPLQRLEQAWCLAEWASDCSWPAYRRFSCKIPIQSGPGWHQDLWLHDPQEQSRSCEAAENHPTQRGWCPHRHSVLHGHWLRRRRTPCPTGSTDASREKSSRSADERKPGNRRRQTHWSGACPCGFHWSKYSWAPECSLPPYFVTSPASSDLLEFFDRQLLPIDRTMGATACPCRHRNVFSVLLPGQLQSLVFRPCSLLLLVPTRDEGKSLIFIQVLLLDGEKDFLHGVVAVFILKLIVGLW